MTNISLVQKWQAYWAHTNEPISAALLTWLDVTTSRARPLPEDTTTSYSIQEAAEALGKTSKEVYDLCITGKLKCVQEGRTLRIPKEALDDSHP